MWKTEDPHQVMHDYHASMEDLIKEFGG